MSDRPQDHAIREQALDYRQSFIVQAPAGSGKTELLTRRVLKLLARVEEPEQILAITFTRKAAREMRERVMGLLGQAAAGQAGDSAHEREGLLLAQEALAQDHRQQWGLLDNPQRLNLRTIDALCTQLAHRLPIVSELGSPMGVVTDAGPLYREAARRCLADDLAELDRVLLHVGNRLQRVEALLASMLASRDQWVRYLGLVLDPEGWREQLERHLAELVSSRLERLHRSIPATLVPALMDCTLRAYRHRQGLGLDPDKPGVDRDGAEGPWRQLASLTTFDSPSLPECEQADLPLWQLLSGAVVTSGGAIRKPKGLNRTLGVFTSKPDCATLGVSLAEAKAFKQQYSDLCEALADLPGLAELFVEIRNLPAGGYDDSDWALLVQLLERLPALNGYLNQVFAEQRRIDFIEMALRARRALGSADEPTDLALAMDLRIQHLLVDEFQDTSQSQFEFLQLLVAGWEPDGARTFFAVGDPMQSIYRFRNADVSLFTRVQVVGLGPLKPVALRLGVNFRAEPGVVEWVNDSFEPLFPRQADLESGAVPYAPSVAYRQGDGGARLHPLVDADTQAEASHVADLTEQALAHGDDGHVAVLVRSKSHAQPILSALQARNVPCQAVEMDLLGERPVVRDLVSLCLALRFVHDRLHWLAVLRAPWCGLTLADLHHLVEGAHASTPLLELMGQDTRRARLSADGQQRLARVRPLLERGVEQSRRDDFVGWLEALWVQLGGPAVCRETRDLNAISGALETLRELDQEDRLWQPSAIDEALNRLFADDADTQEARVQVMTLHKSKGLEFDTVIVPGLARVPRSDDTRLLEWFESGDEDSSMLLLAPFGEVRAEPSPILQLVTAARRRRDEQELLRLLYVACTRACRELHLVACISLKADETPRQPASRTLLGPLWSMFQRAMVVQPVGASAADVEPSADAEIDGGVEPVGPLLARLPADWKAATRLAFEWLDQKVSEPGTGDTAIEFRWAGPRARQIGTVAHEQMQYLADQARVQGLDALGVLIDHRGPVIQRQLLSVGVPKAECEAAVTEVLQAMLGVIGDERGRWCIDPVHTEAHSEWAVSVPGTVQGSERVEVGVPLVRQVVMDRVFVDREGVRWVVDYKMSRHDGSDPAGFLDRERQRYAGQLQGYADIMGRVESRPLRAGLYFPLMGGWREIELAVPQVPEPSGRRDED